MFYFLFLCYPVLCFAVLPCPSFIPRVGEGLVGNRERKLYSSISLVQNCRNIVNFFGRGVGLASGKLVWAIDYYIEKEKIRKVSVWIPVFVLTLFIFVVSHTAGVIFYP